MKKKYTANEVQAALDQCLDFITTQQDDRVIGKILKRLKELFHICDHHWVNVEHGTCDYQEGEWGWGYQLYWVDRCTKCGKICRKQTHWPINVNSID